MTVAEAIAKSKQHIGELLPELGANLQLEELETPPFGSKWRFTFSAILPSTSGANVSQLLKSRRVSKTVEIDSETGDLLALKNAAV